MSKATIVQVSSGKVPPKEHIEAIKKAYPLQFGFALQHEGKLIYESEEKTWKLTIDEIMELLNGTKDVARILFFSNYTEIEDEQDGQPWAILNSEKAPMVAMFYEGDFAKYAGMNGKHTDEFNVLEEEIGPKLANVIDDDIDKLMTGLKSDNFKKKLNNYHGGRAWFTFLPYKGAPFSFGVNSDSTGFDWGTISNKTGIVIAEQKKEEPKKANGPLDFLSAKKSAAPAAQSSASDSGTVLAEKIKDEMIKDMETGIVYTRVKCPTKLDNSAKNFWLRLFNGKDAKAITDGDGQLPGDFQKSEVYIPVHPSLVPFAERECKNSRDVKALYEDIKKARDNGKLKDFPKAQAADSGEDLSRSDGGKSTVREGIYDMTEKDMEQSMTILAEYLGGKSEKRPSPTELMGSDSKKPTFSEKTGITFEELLFTPKAILFKLFGGNKPAVEAFCEMRMWAINKSGIKLEDLAATLTKAEKVEVPSQKPAAAKTGNPLDFLSAKKTA